MMIRAIIILLMVTFHVTLGSVINPFMKSKVPVLYSNKDQIEVVHKYNLYSYYNSDRATFVEFYLHWCGACRRYSVHWKNLGELTKRWHSSVIRLGAVNCADPMNADVCKAFNVTGYPSLKLISPFAKFKVKNHDSTSVKIRENKFLVEDMINFIEKQNNSKLIRWPELSAYTSISLGNLFSKNKYAILIAEKPSSYLGRKLILDYSEVKEKLPVRRITNETNPTLFKELNAGVLPSVYFIKNDSSYELFNQQTLQKLIKSEFVHNVTIKIKNETNEEKKLDLNDPKKYHNLIDSLVSLILNEKTEFNKTNKKNSSEILSSLIDQQTDSERTQRGVSMQDLESGLSYMLRNEISKSEHISGEKLLALKDFLRVLAKYFPGRKPVRKYLGNLYESVKSKGSLSSNEWLKTVESQENDMYLPSKIEWRQCKGSSPIYRGYPCSLWTIFHALTVSQVEQEKTKQNAFGNDYDVKEVIKAIRLYIFNFFGCTECANNFKKETETWATQLNDRYDAIKYLWSIHNKVNERLNKEGNNDPKYPKITFPRKTDCPKCYIVEENENKFNEKEIIKYLISFYSKIDNQGVAKFDSKKIRKPIAKLKLSGWIRGLFTY